MTQACLALIRRWIPGLFAPANHRASVRVSPGERIGALSAFVVIFAAFAFGQVKHWPQTFGDSAFLAEMTDNLVTRGTPLTHINASVVVAWQVLYSPPEVGCGMAMGYLPPVNEFSQHVYSIFYLIAPLARLIPTAVLLPGLMVSAFTGMLLFVYLYARRRGVAVPWALLFCFLVSLHPAWKLSIFGQSYVDRLFVPLGWLLLAALTAERPRFGWILLAAAACTAVNDRAGLLTAIIILGYLVLYPAELPGVRIKTAILAMGVGAISYYLFKFHITNYATHYFPPLRQLFDFSDPEKRELALMAAANAPLLFLAAWDWRALLIALTLMVPNVFGSIGGAEKTGWLTHYHSYYFPVLAWAAFCGFRNLWRAIPANGGWRSARSLGVAGIMLVLIAFGLTLDPDKMPPRLEWTEIAHNPWSRGLAETRAYLRPVGQRPINAFVEISRYIPRGAAVSMLEWGMPTLYPGRDIYLFPTGIDVVNYLILGIKRQEGAHYVYLDVSPYTIPAYRDKLNDCYFRRLAEEGFDLDHPKVFAGGVALIVRKGHQLRAGNPPPPE